MTSLLWTFLRLRKTCKRAYMSISSDREGDCHVTLRVTTPGIGFQSPVEGEPNPGVRRGKALALGTLLLLLQRQLLPLPQPLQQQLLLLQKGARTVVLERCSVTREDDWDGSNRASSHTRLGVRAITPSPWEEE